MKCVCDSLVKTDRFYFLFLEVAVLGTGPGRTREIIFGNPNCGEAFFKKQPNAKLAPTDASWLFLFPL